MEWVGDLRARKVFLQREKDQLWASGIQAEFQQQYMNIPRGAEVTGRIRVHTDGFREISWHFYHGKIIEVRGCVL